MQPHCSNPHPPTHDRNLCLSSFLTIPSRGCSKSSQKHKIENKHVCTMFVHYLAVLYAFCVGPLSVQVASAVVSSLNQDKLLQLGSKITWSDVLLSASVSLVKPSLELQPFHLKVPVRCSGSGNCDSTKSELLPCHLKSHCMVRRSYRKNLHVDCDSPEMEPSVMVSPRVQSASDFVVNFFLLYTADICVTTDPLSTQRSQVISMII